FDFGGETDIAFDDGAFSFTGPAPQAEAESCRPCVHRGAFRHTAVFRVLDHRQIQCGCGGKRLAHDLVVENGLAVVTEGHGACAFERSEICELLAHTTN